MTNPNLTHGNGNGQGQQTVNVDNMFHTETGLDDDDDDDDGNGELTISSPVQSHEAEIRMGHAISHLVEEVS
jgi:hypothetical protein